MKLSRRLIAAAAATAILAGGTVAMTETASAACRDKTQPGTFKGTGCFSVQTVQPDGRAQGRA